MLKNYFKTAWRNLMKNKTFSFINIAGLSIGMAACLLILQYVCFELSFDRFNSQGLAAVLPVAAVLVILALGPLVALRALRAHPALGEP